MPKIVALLALLLAVPARAEVYRCEVAGRPVYTDQPCAAGAAPHALPPLSSLPSAGDADLAKAHDARVEREREAHERDDAAWLKSHGAAKDREARMNQAIAGRKAVKDMKPDELRRALGSPDEVERRAGSEEWVYRDGKSRQTVVIEDGRVVKISRSKNKK